MRGNARGGKGPWSQSDAEHGKSKEIGVSLSTPTKTVQTLQQALQAKAKSEPSFRFYSLWDKVCRHDVLHAAWKHCRSNDGVAGVDDVTFDQIEEQGVQQWLGNLEEELRTGMYRAQPLLREWIPKSNGKQRPLSIPTIRDRVVQAAMTIVLAPIFEPDLLPEQHGFRNGKSAKTALREVHQHLNGTNRVEVVDADLSAYFDRIPHGRVMRCVSRRVSDGHVLRAIKQWLVAPVEEKTRRGRRRTAEAYQRSRGVPQGGGFSPLLANLYFRRFLLAWRRSESFLEDGSRVVNYADDLVICCRRGCAEKAETTMRDLMTRLGLEVNEDKTHVVYLPEESFDFLGYTIARLYRRNGSSYLGTKPSMQSRKRLTRFIREQTSLRHLGSAEKDKVSFINRVVRGWCAYFDLGQVWPTYWFIRWYTERRLRRWLMRKHRRRGSGYRQYPREYLYGVLGLYEPRAPVWGRSSAKV